MDLSQVVFNVADLLGGLMQVFTDLINALIDVLPNPDPFPAMIEQIEWVDGGVWGFSYYWIDSLVGMDFAVQMISFWVTVMVVSAILALIWMMVKWARG